MARTTHLFGLATLTAALLLVACGKTETTASLMAEGKKYLDQGNDKAALIQYRNAVVKSPNDAEARLALGQAYNAVGDPLSAEKELRKALSLGMGERAQTDLLKSLLLQGEFQKVLNDTESVAYTAPAAALALRGAAYLSLSRVDEARETFERALKKEPANRTALLGLARLAIVAGDEKLAMQHIDEASTKNPKDSEVWLFRGDYERAQGKLPEALASYERALQIAPSNGGAHLQKAYLYISTGKYAEAKAALVAARKATPNNVLIYYGEGLVEFAQTHYKEALEPLQKLTRLAPDHMPSVLMLGAVQYKLGSYPQAEQHLKKYVETFPQNVYARKMLAMNRLASHDAKGAIAALTPVLEGSKDIELLSMAGKAYMDVQDYAHATAVLERASALDPKAPALRSSLGLSRLELGENERALAELELATTLDTTSNLSATTLALSAMRLGQFDKAIAALAPLEASKGAADPLVHTLRGAAYQGKGDLVRARASFEKAAALQPGYFAPVDGLARLDIAAKNLDGARQRYEKFLDANKNSVEALTSLGAVAVAQKRGADATSYFERASQVDPNAVGPLLFLASHYASIGVKDKALVLVRKLQVANPNNAGVLSQLGQLQLELGETGQAMETFTKLTVVDPKSAAAHASLGGAHLRMKNLPAADASLKRALSLQPDLLDAQLSLAMVQALQGRFPDALALARQLQKQRPNVAVGFVVEGDLMMAQKKPAAAVPLYEKAYALGKNPELLIKLIEALNASGKGPQVTALIAQWKREHPSDIKLGSYLVSRYMADRAFPAAIDELQAILKVLPGYPPALNNLALAYAEVNDEKALATAEQALKAAPDNPEVMDTAGSIMVMRGDLARGLPLLQKASAGIPGSTEIRYHLITAMIKAGDKTGARRELEAMLANNKVFPRMEQARALLKTL